MISPNLAKLFFRKIISIFLKMIIFIDKYNSDRDSTPDLPKCLDEFNLGTKMSKRSIFHLKFLC